jgi:hypothetical protein
VAVDGFFVAATSALIFARRRIPRFWLIACRDLSPLILDIPLSYRVRTRVQIVAVSSRRRHWRTGEREVLIPSFLCRSFTP